MESLQGAQTTSTGSLIQKELLYTEALLDHQALHNMEYNPRNHADKPNFLVFTNAMLLSTVKSRM